MKDRVKKGYLKFFRMKRLVLWEKSHEKV